MVRALPRGRVRAVRAHRSPLRGQSRPAGTPRDRAPMPWRRASRSGWCDSPRGVAPTGASQSAPEPVPPPVGQQRAADQEQHGEHAQGDPTLRLVTPTSATRGRSRSPRPGAAGSTSASRAALPAGTAVASCRTRLDAELVDAEDRPRAVRPQGPIFLCGVALRRMPRPTRRERAPDRIPTLIAVTAEDLGRAGRCRPVGVGLIVRTSNSSRPPLRR
jgi:hypothetical protein